MDKLEFISIRKRLGKTQKEMATLLGSSLKAVHSYEQGWRKIPVHIERQVYFLLTRFNRDGKKQKPCWEQKKCSARKRKSCAAWEFKSGDLCWFINGTICEGGVQNDWQAKLNVCTNCRVLTSLLDQIEDNQLHHDELHPDDNKRATLRKF